MLWGVTLLNRVIVATTPLTSFRIVFVGLKIVFALDTIVFALGSMRPMLSSVQNGQKNFRSDPFHFPLLYVRFRICGVPFPYLWKWERGFFVRFRGIPFSPEIDPYLFRFSSCFKFI
jgi:hypothetical protein